MGKGKRNARRLSAGAEKTNGGENSRKGTRSNIRPTPRTRLPRDSVGSRVVFLEILSASDLCRERIEGFAKIRPTTAARLCSMIYRYASARGPCSGYGRPRSGLFLEKQILHSATKILVAIVAQSTAVLPFFCIVAPV